MIRSALPSFVTRTDRSDVKSSTTLPKSRGLLAVMSGAGPDAPETLEAQMDLASAISGLGQDEKAINLEEDVLARRIAREGVFEFEEEGVGERLTLRGVDFDVAENDFVRWQ